MSLFLPPVQACVSQPRSPIPISVPPHLGERTRTMGGQVKHNNTHTHTSIQTNTHGQSLSYRHTHTHASNKMLSTQYPNFWDQKRICVKSFWCQYIANVLQNQCKLYCDQEQHVALYDQHSTVWSRSGAGQMEGNSQRAANLPPPRHQNQSAMLDNCTKLFSS